VSKKIVVCHGSVFFRTVVIKARNESLKRIVRCASLNFRFDKYERTETWLSASCDESAHLELETHDSWETNRKGNFL